MSQMEGIGPGVSRSAAKGTAKRASKGGGSKAKKPRKGKKKVLLIWAFFVILFAIVCAVVGYLLVILNGERVLSANINKLNLSKASIVTDSGGKEVAKLYVSEGNREYVPYGEIPDLLQKAFVAVEDKRFYEHSGVDLVGIGRALVKDVIARSAVEGASTITQQLAKNVFLNADKTLFRKGTEASIALALEREYTKQQILELYLNRIYFGAGQYGILTAAKYYFGVKSLDELEVWQIATLAGMPKAPNTYNPYRNPEKSMERRAVVLQLMYDQGLITEKEKDEAAEVPFERTAPKQNTKYLSYLDYVVQEAVDRTGKSEDELLTAGYTIKTALNTKAQNAMETAFADDAMFEKSKDDKIVQGAMIIMDQHDGSLVAMVGGRNYEKSGTNRVMSQRQPGSSFKPIMDYGPAIETGKYFPWTTVQDVKHCFGSYCPSNSNKVQYRGEIPMSEAIKESRNVSAVWLLNQIGIDTGMSFAEKLGIKLDKEDRNLASAIGGLNHGVTPLQMARAYGAFANGGKLQDPHTILSITDENGRVVYEYKAPKAKQVMKPETSYYVTQLLQGVVGPGGTGTRAKFGSGPIAGKTGTTQAAIPNFKTSGNRDVWFVGYTPEWTAAVWYGYDYTDKDHYLKESSGQAAAMFARVMAKGLEGVKKQSFPVPDDLKPEEEAPPEKPAGVTGFTGAYDPANVSVELNWSPVEGEGITYKIYRKDETQSDDFSQLVEVADTSYDDLALLPDRKYTYYVTAYQASTKLESDPSEQIVIEVASGVESSPPPDNGQGEQSPPPTESETPTESPTNPDDGTSSSPPPDNQGESPPSSSPPPAESSPPPDVPASTTPTDNPASSSPPPSPNP